MEAKIKQRNFVESDLPEIIAFRREGVRISFPSHEFNEARFTERFLRYANKHPERVQVLERNGEIIGYIWFGVSDGDTGKHGELHQIFIREGFRKKGLAKRLLSYAEKHLASMGANSMRITATDSNCRAVKFYEKMKYRRIRTVMEKRL
jgi:ribosomal protein S18 acetylase RimI-like enzyme